MTDQKTVEDVRKWLPEWVEQEMLLVGDWFAHPHSYPDAIRGQIVSTTRALRDALAKARKENERLRELIVTAAHHLLHGEPDVGGLLSSELTKDEIRQVMEADDA